MSKPETRTRNSVSELSVYLPAERGLWPNLSGGFRSYPGYPGYETPLEAFNTQIASMNNALLPEVNVEVIETMTDVITPGFHEMVKKGEFLPINPMSKGHYLNQPVAVTDVHLKQLTVGSPTFAEGVVMSQRYVAPVPVPGAIASDDEVNALLLEAKAKLKQAGMDYLTTAAEFRETLGMFLNMKENLLNRRDGAVKAWSKDLAQKRRSGKFKGFNSLKEGWEAFSSFWLEYRFGWRILAYDIEAIIDYYKRRDDGILLFTRRVTEKFTDSSAQLHSYPQQLDTGSFFEMWKHVEASESVRVGFSAHIDQSVLGNPILLNTVYDITPWTLVVEMFFNVQDNIIALSAFPIGCSEVPDSGFVSRERTVAMTLLPKIVSTKGLQVDERVITVQTPGINRSYVRSKIGEPSFDISYKPNLDLGKIIDLATLALPIFRIIRNFLK